MTELPVILVVDDDEPILLLMWNLLREFGFEPVAAADGREAIEQARQRKPDLILLDRNMPGMTGDEVLAELRSTPSLATVPVLILSGEPLAQEEIATLGASAAVLKPFDVSNLIATIRLHLVPQD